MDAEIVFFIVKLAVGGIVSFLSIMLMSKTRDPAWMALVCGFLFTYASIVYDLMVTLGIFSKSSIVVFGLPLIPLLFTIVPGFFYILAFLIMILRK